MVLLKKTRYNTTLIRENKGCKNSFVGFFHIAAKCVYISTDQGHCVLEMETLYSYASD